MPPLTKPKILSLLFLLLVSCTFAKQKSYTLNYQPKGKIIKIMFGVTATVYTDSTSFYKAAPVLLNSQSCYNKAKYDSICKTIRNILKTSDTVWVNSYQNDSLNSLTINGCDFELIAIKLIETNKAYMYCGFTKKVVTRVLIQKTKIGELYDMVVKDKHNKLALIDYYTPPQITSESIRSALNKLKKHKPAYKNGKTYYTDTIKLSQTQLPLDSNEFYFPAYIFYDRDVYGTDKAITKTNAIINARAEAYYLNQRFSHLLYLFNEPILYSRPQKNEILRIMVNPTFSQPFCITLTNADSSILQLKYLKGKGGYSYGKPLTTLSKNMGKTLADSLIGSFKNSPALKENINSNTPSYFFDGSTYIVEYIAPKKYYIYYRHVIIDESILSIINYALKTTNAKIENGK